MWAAPDIAGWPPGSVVLGCRAVLMLANAAAAGSGARRGGVCVCLAAQSGLEPALASLWPAAPFTWSQYGPSAVSQASVPAAEPAPRSVRAEDERTVTVVVQLLSPAAARAAAAELSSPLVPLLSSLRSRGAPFLLAVVHLDDTAARTQHAAGELSPSEAAYARRRARGQTRAAVEGETRLLLERVQRALDTQQLASSSPGIALPGAPLQANVSNPNT